MTLDWQQIIIMFILDTCIILHICQSFREILYAGYKLFSGKAFCEKAGLFCVFNKVFSCLLPVLQLHSVFLIMITFRPPSFRINTTENCLTSLFTSGEAHYQ